ncbi:hypothetical protein CHLNCDRAFT_134486 [Chlorella variabilis]|uniref:Uncharacterized protein n=1 Tax=Chlorella variabilis TaxID=554065 RepID=E1ZG32_CHLVA|nr:hypothetical protein CHLNCDRAFT_134486 [Chlorella variabilis]EFN55226.1 hypothetical protein CHLNCDRAFT_134486 [Chlorella variabilis]|eukprot:XP_005847328.1 hypothetical protein CHLNCDRAFT_134486 [Chlorella variabilis]
MAVKAPSAAWAWLAWLLLGAGWVIMLAGVSALQDDCGSSNVNAFGVAGTAGYLAPISCDDFYNYAWWHVWYTFAMLFILPVFLAAGWVHKWRVGLIGLLIPLVVLLQYTCDTFLGLWETGPQGGSQEARAKVLFSGSLLSCIAIYSLIILFGVYDERSRPPDVRV